jgi:hypothetical protein
MKFYLHLNFDINMYFKFIFVVIQSSNFFNIHYYIPNLKGDNYKIWKERILFYLGWMDIDYTIRKDELLAITNTSTSKDIVLYEQ